MTLPLPRYDGTNVQAILDVIAMAIPSGGIATGPRIVSGGKTSIAGADSTSSTAYTTLPTPDSVTVALPTDGLILVGYQAIWQSNVASNARAAIFLSANQLKAVPAAGGAPVVQEVTGPSAINADAGLATYPVGNGAFIGTAGLAGTTEVTTGQLFGTTGGGSPVFVFAAAGSYAVSVQFKNVAAGTTTVKNRHLWVAAFAFA